MQIDVHSRLDPARVYLSARVDARAEDSYEVCSLESSLPRVKEYYRAVLSGDFDYSFVSERGQHLFYGMAEYPARNLLLSVAYESARYHRVPKFSASSSDMLNAWVAGSGFSDALINTPRETLPQIAALLTQQNAVRDFSAWLYFVLQCRLFAGEAERVSAVLGGLFEQNTSFASLVLNSLARLDPEFASLWAPKGTYRTLRELATSSRGLDDLSLLAVLRPINGSHAFRSESELRLAARSANVGAFEPSADLWAAIERALDLRSCTVPTFLPDGGKRPATLAMQVLRHFQSELPRLEIVAEVLGTRIISTDLPSDILGLFVEHPEAHGSAILVNRRVRSRGSQRFTIAHELGHYLLHRGEGFLCGYHEVYDPARGQEWEANEFAAELLMPIGQMREDAQRRFGSLELRDVASRFGVSMEAVARRIIEVARRRQLAFIVVVGQEIVSLAASVVRDDGLRWIGRPSVRREAMPLDAAYRLHQSRETRLERYLPHATGEWLQDLEIDLHPFSDGRGYYLLLERSV